MPGSLRPKQRVRFLLGPVEGSEEKELTLTATSVPSLVNHPLVCGPAFTHLKVGMGHRLDVQASGVLVLGVGHGCRLLTDMYNAHLTKDYTVRGLLGKATDDFCEDGRLVEKTTYDHVTREKLDRILAMIQGSHQKALVMYSNLDLKTQEAYEMAVRPDPAHEQVPDADNRHPMPPLCTSRIPLRGAVHA